MTSTIDITIARKIRRDGWTPARRAAFLAFLRDGLDVRRASARVGMSRRSAYHVRARDEDFAIEWDAALRTSRADAEGRFIALLVAQAPWARATFPEVKRASGEDIGISSQDSVTDVTCV